MDFFVLGFIRVLLLLILFLHFNSILKLNHIKGLLKTQDLIKCNEAKIIKRY